MQIKIETPFQKTELDVADLTQDERSALAGVLGLRSAKAEFFKAAAAIPKFKKITLEQLWAKCPHSSSKFKFEVTVTPVPDTVDGLRIIEKFTRLLPGAAVIPRLHVMDGYCDKCETWHAVEKFSAMVILDVSGVRFVQVYEA